MNILKSYSIPPKSPMAALQSPMAALQSPMAALQSPMAAPQSPMAAPQSPMAALSPRSICASMLIKLTEAIKGRKPRPSKNSTCHHGKKKIQCPQCHGTNICEHGKRRTRCPECWENGCPGTTELCDLHGKRKGACGVCIRNGVHKRFTHTPCPHMKFAYLCPHCREINRELQKERKGKLHPKI